MALVYRKKTSNFEVFSIQNPDNYEMLATVGKVAGIKGKLFVLSCYATPNMPPAEAAGMIEYMAEVICQAKRNFVDCTIVVNGDFNQWPVWEIMEDHPDLVELQHGPTRNDKKIDRTYTNFDRSIVESCTLAPLETEVGNVSDHMMVFGRAVFPPAPKNNVTYTHRPYTEQGARAFLAEIEKQNWQSVLSEEDVEAKVAAFQKILDEFMDRFFPLKTTTKRVSDPPWVNDQIRKL